MWRQVISVLLNLAFDPILIFLVPNGDGGNGLGTQGAAISTVVSQLIVGVWMVWFFVSSKSGATINLSLSSIKGSVDWKMIAKICSLGLGQLLSNTGSQIAPIIFNITFKRELPAESVETYQAAMGAITRIFTLIGMPAMGIAMGFVPFVGYNIGKKQPKRVYLIIKYALICMLLIGGFFLAMVEIFAPSICKAFNSDPLFLEIAPKAMRISISMLWMFPFSYLLLGYFQVAQKALFSLVIGAIQPIGVLILSLVIPKTSLGIEGIWYVQPIATIISTCVSLPLILNIIAKSKKLADKEDATEIIEFEMDDVKV
ncbi:Multi antimicrobial extrusion protein like protein [Aduncisulcus paluster]|nr:Multi antimicrobial extrusion protein like protein [Aduncisulcus paluster]